MDKWRAILRGAPPESKSPHESGCTSAPPRRNVKAADDHSGQWGHPDEEEDPRGPTGRRRPRKPRVRVPGKPLTWERMVFLYAQSLRASALSSLLSRWGPGPSPEALASMKRVAKDHSRCCHRSTPGSASAAEVSANERERETRGNEWVTLELRKAPGNCGHTGLHPGDGSTGRWVVLSGRQYPGTQTRAIPSDLSDPDALSARRRGC